MRLIRVLVLLAALAAGLLGGSLSAFADPSDPGFDQVPVVVDGTQLVPTDVSDPGFE
jgi:hypothetical protein